ncbi:MAG TPA: pyridoxamine 5'-phosphate oxidase family protein [Prolixibacteraceae bacterium]|nr:pyridoxamine 5'-phosphate oxidase family protein [Prolixibacteraceae bacterium]
MRTVFIDDKETIEKVILSCRTCYLGLCDAENRPYVIPMNFGYRDGVIYLHSGQSGRKWEIMHSNPNACITFCSGDELAYQDEQVACSWRMKSSSVIAEGQIEFVDDFEEKKAVLKILMAHYSDREFQFKDPAVRNVGVFKMKIEKIHAKEFGAKAITPWNS